MSGIQEHVVICGSLTFYLPLASNTEAVFDRPPPYHV